MSAKKMSDSSENRETFAEMSVVAVILLCVLGYFLNHGDLSKMGEGSGAPSASPIGMSKSQ